MTDEELMLAYGAGDETAFAMLYRKHSGKVYAYLKRKLATPEEVEDVFQKTFYKLHKSRGKYDPAYPFTQWLFVIAKTSTLDHFRKMGRQVPTAGLDEFGDIFPDQLSQTEGTSALNEVADQGLLQGLSAEQKRAIEMRVIEEKSYTEIALALKKTEQNVRQIVSRALKKLRMES